jgi:hypothetical protein
MNTKGFLPSREFIWSDTYLIIINERRDQQLASLLYRLKCVPPSTKCGRYWMIVVPLQSEIPVSRNPMLRPETSKDAAERAVIAIRAESQLSRPRGRDFCEPRGHYVAHHNVKHAVQGCGYSLYACTDDRLDCKYHDYVFSSPQDKVRVSEGPP